MEHDDDAGSPVQPALRGVRRRWRRIVTVASAIAVLGALAGAVVEMTLEDFQVPGTQVGDVQQEVLWNSAVCSACHQSADGKPGGPDPWFTWRGSLMAQAGRDPLFFAQMATAEQDVANVGYYCMRCHVPLSIPSGHADVADGSALDAYDLDGVNCHFCHSMVDPRYKEGSSPIEDAAILASIAQVPEYYGDAMFVLDPEGRRRGPRSDADALHQVLPSPFHRSSDMCGTCHDVGNVAISRLPDGTYSYNTVDAQSPSSNPWLQFPLERTYTEWKLSAFAAGGVDMGGRFGGSGNPVVSTCQDCHMPVSAGAACVFGPPRKDLRRHDFAGASVTVLSMIAAGWQGDPSVDPVAIDAAKARNVSMLERAASLQAEQVNGSLRVRVTNESAHKIPTGHIEGRRMWVVVRLLDAEGTVLRTYGAYDATSAELDAATTEVYEMVVGLSAGAAALTGYPTGPTGHMSLADTIVKDNRVPPRGFSNVAFAAGGAPVVGHEYADGEHWDDSWFALVPGTARSEVELRYQNVPKEYVEHLRNGNHSNQWGEVLHDLWEATDRGAPVLMASLNVGTAAFVPGDLDGNGRVDGADLGLMLGAWGKADSPADLVAPRGVNGADLGALLGNWGAHGP